MGEDITVRESGIYLLNRVEVTLKDDSRAEGILQNIAAETITVEGREIMLSDVADIRLAGELTDYNVMRDTGMIGNFTFTPEACRDAAELELMRYGDFACTVSCHLKLAAGKICADDIRLVSHTHKVCVEKLSQTEAIYRFFDGSFYFSRMHSGRTALSGTATSHRIMRRWRTPDCRAEISCFRRIRLTLDSNRAISTWFPTLAPKNLVRWCRKRSV